MSRSARRALGAMTIAAAFVVARQPAAAQERGAAQLHLLVRGLTVTPRVLVIGVRPEDDDSQLLAWLARGHMVETGFLSLTRGESGLNYLGTESGTALGAVRTQETLAARRIDGAEQFFTRAYDFGFARTPDEVYKRWQRDTLLGDIITVIRSFRPHVIVASVGEGFRGDDGQHQALIVLARDAYEAAGDSVHFPASRYGLAWQPLKLYKHGAGLVIDPKEFDPVLGSTYAEIATDSRAQRRSEGFANGLLGNAGTVRLQRVASRASEETTAADERSLFDGVDTSFMRFAAAAPPNVAEAIPLIVAYADSARAALDLERPERAVTYLVRVAQLAASARGNAPWCRHPSADAAPPSLIKARCEARWLDLDASIDLVRRRAADALLLAAGVSFEATIDRELVAAGDTAIATVTMFNHGRVPVTLASVDISGSPPSAAPPVVVAPDSNAHVLRTVAGLMDQRPWWIGTGKEDNFFPRSVAAVDGVAHPDLIAATARVQGTQVPEEIRRETDVSVSVAIAGTTVTTSLGPLVHRYADAQVGRQDRTPGGVPPVTLEFDHRLEWIPAHKPINRSLRLAVKSFSDATQTFTLQIVAPKGVRIDSLPATITLAPREQRDVFLHMRGMLDIGRFEFGVRGLPVGAPRAPNAPVRDPYIAGFQTVQYAHLPPVRLFHSSALYLQSVEISMPQQLGVLYVKGVGDDIPMALKQLGISNFVVSAEDLLAVRRSRRVTTIVLGRAAYELHPELVAQNGRLMDFVRQGGTLIVQQGELTTTQTNVLPYPATLHRINPERIGADAPVAVLEPKSRLLSWPNTIVAEDWGNWVGERAVFVPTTADPRYSTLIETHDAEQPENRNAILVAHLGKGTYVYTTLTFFQQIPGGVSGGMRLFVNLLSGSVPGKTAP